MANEWHEQAVEEMWEAAQTLPEATRARRVGADRRAASVDITPETEESRQKVDDGDDS